jgi:hypothetical protein
MVAHGDHAGAVLPHAPLSQRSPFRIRFPSHMEGWPPVWQAGSGRSPGHQCSSRTLSRLLVYGEVSGVGFLRSRNCSYAGDLSGLCPLWELGNRHDAACGRTCHGRSAGAPTLGKRLIVGADVITLADFPLLIYSDTGQWGDTFAMRRKCRIKATRTGGRHDPTEVTTIRA